MSYVSEVTADAPVFWMRFAEPDGSSVFTTEGGSYTATLTGTGNVAPGPISNALAFGVGSGFLVSDYSAINSTAATYSFFVKHTNGQNGHHYLSMSDALSGGLYAAAGQDNPYASPAAGYPGLGWLQGTEYAGRKSTTKDLSDGAWHHIIMRFAGTSGQPASSSIFTIWVDGTPVDDTDMINGTTVSMPQTTSFLRIGESHAGLFTGGFSIAEVVVFDYALTTQRIATHFRESGFLPLLDVFYGSIEIGITTIETINSGEIGSINILLTALETDKHADAGSINVHSPRVKWGKFGKQQQ